MLVQFRHGIVKQSRDTHGEPNFLKLVGNTVSVQASQNNPLTILFSYLDMDYLSDIDTSVLSCEVELNQSFIYLDMDVLTGEIKIGSTKLPIFYTDNEPQDVITDQHWFDVNDAVMRVYDGAEWQDKFRVCIGEVIHGHLKQYRIGGKVSTPGNGKYVAMDTFGYPMRTQKPKDSIGQLPRFLSTPAKDLTKTKTLVKYNDFLVGGKTVTPIHSFTLVHLQQNKRVITADSTNPYTRIIGMVLDASAANTLVDVKTFGFITNELWNWTDAEISRPLFCDANGNPTTSPPTTGVLQQIGFVCSTDTIFLDIKRPIILTLPQESFSFVPGDLVPSVKISFLKEKKFVGSEILIAFEDVPQSILAGNGVSIDYEVVNNNILQGNEISFSYNVPNLNLFTASNDILYSFNVVDNNTFNAGEEIPLLSFSKYDKYQFGGGMDTFTFNTSMARTLSGDFEPNLIGFSIFALDTFRAQSEHGVIMFTSSPLNVFVPANEILFEISAVDKTIFLGSIGGGWTFQSVAKKLFGVSKINHTMTISVGNTSQFFTAHKAIQLLKFSA